MRHRVAFRKLGRDTEHRLSMLRNLVASLIEKEKVITTLPKAKEARRLLDKMVTLAKRGDLHARRQALAFLRDKKAVKKLFDELGPRFSGRSGGYSRVIKLGWRKGDAAEMAALELVEGPQVEGEKGKEA